VGDETVDELYRLVLRREPDPAARAEVAGRLAEGTLSRSGLLAEPVASDEFGRLRAVEDGIALARAARGTRPHGLTGPPGTDERVIEIPWVLARYGGEPRVLDLGSANADPAYLDALLDAAPTAVGVDVAEAEIPGLPLQPGDLRDLPFERRSFDVVFCVSTLEHVGSDNAVYGVGPGEGGIPEALDEIRRVLTLDGYALVTVPCGEDEDRGRFVQHDRDGWNRLYAAADLYVFDQELYLLGPGGWQASEDANVRYGERGRPLRPSSARSCTPDDGATSSAAGWRAWSAWAAGSARVPAVAHKVEHLTGAQKAKLEEELAELEGPKRVEVVQAIKTARSFGDLSENFEYHAAKNEQALLERRITILRSRLGNSVLIDEEAAAASDSVAIGSTVQIADETGDTMEIEISSVGGVSPDSPLGRALLGAKVGDEVEIEAPRGFWRATVLSIGR
jgi:transcription elongation factor GreA